MNIAAARANAPDALRVLRSPLLWLLIAVAVLPLFLLARLTVPIGPMYWDLFVYFDAAGRIFHGETPVIDFFVPVGPLGYYLFAGGLKLFAHAQPLLLASWSMLAVTGPLMALVLLRMRDVPRGVAFAVLVPFLVFAILPFNTREFFPYPGSDGFGIYNRQASQLLYVLVAALVFMRAGRTLAVVVALTMAALFFTKITGFVAGGLVCLFAFLAGRLTFKHAAASALGFLALLGMTQAWNGMVSHYLADILSLVGKNADTLLPRFLHAGSDTLGIIGPASLLALVLLWTDRRVIRDRLGALRRAPRWRNLAAIVDHDAAWLAVTVFAGLFFETQNTGSQTIILIVPVVVAIVAARLPPSETPRPHVAAIALLASAAVLPPFVHTIHRAGQTYASALINTPLEHENLKTLGSVNARFDVMDHAHVLKDIYADHRATYREFVEDETKPAFMYYLQYGFQLVHLMATDEVIGRIRALEARKNIRFDTIFELNFVDPIPYLMGRRAPKYVAIGADPTRAVPTPSPREETAVRETDLILYPTCPLTTDNDALRRLYEPALEDHFRIALDPCFDAYVNPRFAQDFEEPSPGGGASDEEVPVATMDQPE